MKRGNETPAPAKAPQFLDKDDFWLYGRSLLMLQGAPDLSATVLFVERVKPEYFGDKSRQHCIVEFPNGQRFVAFYD